MLHVTLTEVYGNISRLRSAESQQTQ
uniref:Uncharacterized protein n=1 Tax=Arundo donax TaxID=35708 RepID=A0A0A9E0D9_ARUDO